MQFSWPSRYFAIDSESMSYGIFSLLRRGLTVRHLCTGVVQLHFSAFIGLTHQAGAAMICLVDVSVFERAVAARFRRVRRSVSFVSFGCYAMHVEDIGERIDVLASCVGGRVNPLRFRWSGRTYAVQSVNARWTDRSGGSYSLHYSVQVGDETYLLRFSGADVQWWLDKQMVE